MHKSENSTCVRSCVTVCLWCLSYLSEIHEEGVINKTILQRRKLRCKSLSTSQVFFSHAVVVQFKPTFYHFFYKKHLTASAFQGPWALPATRMRTNAVPAWNVPYARRFPSASKVIFLFSLHQKASLSTLTQVSRETQSDWITWRCKYLQSKQPWKTFIFAK